MVEKKKDSKPEVKKDKVKKVSKEDLKKVGGGAKPAAGGCTANCPGHTGTFIQGKTVS